MVIHFDFISFYYYYSVRFLDVYNSSAHSTISIFSSAFSELWRLDVCWWRRFICSCVNRNLLIKMTSTGWSKPEDITFNHWGVLHRHTLSHGGSLSFPSSLLESCWKPARRSFSWDNVLTDSCSLGSESRGEPEWWIGCGYPDAELQAGLTHQRLCFRHLSGVCAASLSFPADVWESGADRCCWLGTPSEENRTRRNGSEGFLFLL